MKKNGPTERRNATDNTLIKDYGHDRAIHSLGRGGKNSRTRARRQLRNLLLALSAAVVLITAFGLFWPFMPWLNPDETDGTTTAPSSAASSMGTSKTSQSSATTIASSTTATTTAAPTGLSAEERAARLKAAGDGIIALLQVKPGRFGVCYRNLAGGETWEFQADQPFVAASSIKLGFVTCLYLQIAEGNVSLDEKLTYDSRSYPTGDFEAGTGTIKNMADGTLLSVRETAELTVRISDNCGTNMILRRLGGVETVNAWLKSVSSIVDYRSPVTYTDYFGNTYTEKKNRTSAADLSAHAAKLYQLWQQSPSDYDLLIEDLSNTEFDFGIQKGVPSTVRVAHKIGTNGSYSTENDVGIVFASEPYALCVMTEMSSAEAARKVQADVSKIIYEYIEGLS